MILRFPDSKPRHLSIEADPFMFWMSVFDLATLDQSRCKVNLQEVLLVSEMVGHIDTVRYPHVVTSKNRLPIKLDMSECVESIKGEDVLLAWLCWRDPW